MRSETQQWKEKTEHNPVQCPVHGCSNEKLPSTDRYRNEAASSCSDEKNLEEISLIRGQQ